MWKGTKGDSFPFVFYHEERYIIIFSLEIDSMNMSLSKLWEMVKDREAWYATEGHTE